MKYIKTTLFIIIFIVGIIVGVTIQDFPRLKLNTEIRFFEPLSFLLTATIGILIPFFIKRWIDDSRQVKNHLVDELKDTLREISTIKERIKSSYYKSAITQGEKNEINALFEQADLKLNCLDSQLSESFDKETANLRQEIKNEYINYWKLTTGAEIMSSKFKRITENFFKRHNECYSNLETKIKQAITKVYRL